MEESPVLANEETMGAPVSSEPTQKMVRVLHLSIYSRSEILVFCVNAFETNQGFLRQTFTKFAMQNNYLEIKTQ